MGLKWERNTSLKRKTIKKTNDRESVVILREVEDGVLEVGGERENAGCRKGVTRQREVLSHGQQLAD